MNAGVRSCSSTGFPFPYAPVPDNRLPFGVDAHGDCLPILRLREPCVDEDDIVALNHGMHRISGDVYRFWRFSGHERFVQVTEWVPQETLGYAVFLKMPSEDSWNDADTRLYLGERNDGCIELEIRRTESGHIGLIQRLISRPSRWAYHRLQIMLSPNNAVYWQGVPIHGTAIEIDAITT
jgi:hypothetical protein